MNKIELLAPVGDFERLVAAIYFGADAVYLGGKNFGLRAFANNFDEEELKNLYEKSNWGFPQLLFILELYFVRVIAIYFSSIYISKSSNFYCIFIYTLLKIRKILVG